MPGVTVTLAGMNTLHSRTRSAHLSPMLWTSVIVLGLSNVTVQIARSTGLLDEASTWLEFAIASVTLVLVIRAVASFVQHRMVRSSRRAEWSTGTGR